MSLFDKDQQYIENPTIVDVYINNTDYFAMIDNQVRRNYSIFEEHTLLPKVKSILEENSINFKSLLEYPIEGYYYKTPGLQDFFKIIRNFQENEVVYKSIKQSTLVDEIKWLLSQTIWGSEPSERTTSPFPRRKDILTLCMNKMDICTIPTIMDGLKKYFTNTPNLVELAFLTGNAACIVASAETNALYRDFACISGLSLGLAKIKYVYHWDVSKDMQNLGERLIDAYNLIINKFQNKIEIDEKNKFLEQEYKLKNPNSFWFNERIGVAQDLVYPSLDNHFECDRGIEKPRVAFLGKHILTGENYFWILERDGSVRDLLTNDFYTTQSYRDNGGPVDQKEVKWNLDGIINTKGEFNLEKL